MDVSDDLTNTWFMDFVLSFGTGVAVEMYFVDDGSTDDGDNCSFDAYDDGDNGDVVFLFVVGVR